MKPPADQPADQLLTINEAAALMGVSVPALRRWIRRQLLPVERVGPFRRPRIRRSVLLQYFPADLLPPRA